MAEALVNVELVYALADRQIVLTFDVPAGTTVRDGVARSGIAGQLPDVRIADCPIGIFGKVVADPDVRLLEAGDRIELYRPLLADPKEARKQRADKVRRVYKKARR